MTDHAYLALTQAQQRAGQLQQAIAGLRATLKLAGDDHPLRANGQAMLDAWVRDWEATKAEIARLQETGEGLR